MFDYLYTEAYSILRKEIEALAKELFSDDNDYNVAYNLYHAGQLNAINRVLKQMNAVQDAFDKSFDEEVKRFDQEQEQEKEEKENV